MDCFLPSKSFIYNVYFSYNFFRCLRFLLFWIKSQPGSTCKNVSWKTSIVGLQPSKHEEITFLVIFVFISYFIGVILSKKKVKMWRVRRKVFRATLSELICQLLLKKSHFPVHFLEKLAKKIQRKTTVVVRVDKSSKFTSMYRTQGILTAQYLVFCSVVWCPLMFLKLNIFKMVKA